MISMFQRIQNRNTNTLLTTNNSIKDVKNVFGQSYICTKNRPTCLVGRFGSLHMKQCIPAPSIRNTPTLIIHKRGPLTGMGFFPSQNCRLFGQRFLPYLGGSKAWISIRLILRLRMFLACRALEMKPILSNSTIEIPNGTAKYRYGLCGSVIPKKTISSRTAFSA